MTYLLFPGRHILNTKFQEEYLKAVLSKRLADQQTFEPKNSIVTGDKGAAKKHDPETKIDMVIYAVTSANQSHSRYNPVSFHERLVGLDRLAQKIKHESGIPYRIIGIPHFNPSPHFAEYIIKEIAEFTEGELHLLPSNTVVLASTIELIEQYHALGFSILPAELDINTKANRHKAPVAIVKDIVASKEDWKKSESAMLLSDATKSTWEDFPSIPKTMFRIWRDPLLTDSGSLTLDRNYSIYAYNMGNDVLLELKYQDIKGAIGQGKIADEGCADGALMIKLARDFPDADIVGIELTAEFQARCEERLRSGEFGGAYVHFHQRNLLDTVFEDNSIDNTICNSTTHELWSYGNRGESLRGYLDKKFKQTAKGGRIIIRDVVGPEDKDQEVYMLLDSTDGKNGKGSGHSYGENDSEIESDEHIFKAFDSKEELKNHLSGLSTYARFKRFAEEYLKDMRTSGRRGDDTKILYKEERIADANGEKNYIVVRLKDAVEFMTKKDYVDNWKSELNEEFAFWSFSEWKSELAKAGFTVLENPNQPSGTSRVYTSPWIVENRWKNTVTLFKKSANSHADNNAGDDSGGSLEPIEYPPTHMVLVGEKTAKE